MRTGQEIATEAAKAGDSAERARFKATARRRRDLYDRLFTTAALAATTFGLVVLAVLLIDVAMDGLTRLSWDFLSSYPSRRPEDAGILSALVGTIWLLGLTAIISFPIGVGAAIYLEEYAWNNWISRVIEVNISNLAGVPSIIYGLLGLGIFVRVAEPLTGGRSVLAGALTLSLLILPVIIIATREAIRTVPSGQREAGYALGATNWQVVRGQVLPMALPGSLTGTILALSRAIGETAPLIMIGALTLITFLPEPSPAGLQSQFTALPIQIFNWVSRPQEGFHTAAAAGILVLLTVMLMMNAGAIYLRNRLQRRL
ncbi:MAG: phosphate ABC transporter permease PstA [Dehalococcoidia bacterium]